MSHLFASILLVDRRGFLLLQERDEHPKIDPERWGFVGGHVEDGEDPDAAAGRELTEETGLRIPSAELPVWREFEVFHEAYGTNDIVRVHVAATNAVDEDIVLGEGRQIVFVDPDQVLALPLTAAARIVLPLFLESDLYQRLRP